MQEEEVMTPQLQTFLPKTDVSIKVLLKIWQWFGFDAVTIQDTSFRKKCLKLRCHGNLVIDSKPIFLVLVLVLLVPATVPVPVPCSVNGRLVVWYLPTVQRDLSLMHSKSAQYLTLFYLWTFVISEMGCMVTNVAVHTWHLRQMMQYHCCQWNPCFTSNMSSNGNGSWVMCIYWSLHSKYFTF